MLFILYNFIIEIKRIIDLFIYINELIKISNLTKEENEHFTNLMKKL